MGKKGKDKKKGKGAEKTAAKTDKKLSNKQKKELEALGEDNIEDIIAQIESEEKKRNIVSEVIVGPPTRRANSTLIPHPDKDELILFGGEFYDGQKTMLYNDLYFYNIANNSWTLVKVPGAPPSRCGHQMIATATNKGQLWLFGGEYASPSQSQFYHYRDLWLYHLSTKRWEKIPTSNGPSARSGHRMVYLKKQIIVFGGFHDNLRDYKYFNDLYSFNTETYKWTRLEPSGTCPAPRSGCCLVALSDGKILMYGGYSKEKIKKEVDKGRVYTDSFLLTPEKNDETGTKWKWVNTKLGGITMSPRCSMPMTSAPNNTAYCFGGVYDTEEDEENISGTFYNELYSLDLQRLVWRDVTVTGKRPNGDNKPRRRKEKEDETEEDSEMGEVVGDVVMEVEEAVTVVADDGVFKVSVGPALTSNITTSDSTSTSAVEVFQPTARMNGGLAVKHGVLYLYGGLVEDGDRQITLGDFYSLDLKKLDEWRTIISDDVKTVEWLGSDSESDNGDESSENGEDSDDSESGDEDD